MLGRRDKPAGAKFKGAELLGGALDPQAPPPVVAVIAPRYPGSPGTTRRLYSNVSNRYRLWVTELEDSILPKCFNELWCLVNNQQLVDKDVKFCVMLHADVLPMPFYADALVDAANASGADFVSALVPLKNGSGSTSTAVDNPADPWKPLARLTMKEAFQLPVDFTAADVARLPAMAARGVTADSTLLLNTGCWIARLGRPWNRKVHFQFHDRIVWDADGVGRAENISEDWDFSRQLKALGVKTLCTRRVELAHIGQGVYPNNQPFGALETDGGFNEETEAAEPPAKDPAPMGEPALTT